MGAAIANDMLEGVQAIAAFLGWEGKAGERRVYHLRERVSDCPIRKRPGLGYYAFKSELEAWLKAEETKPSAAA